MTISALVAIRQDAIPPMTTRSLCLAEQTVILNLLSLDSGRVTFQYTSVTYTHEMLTKYVAFPNVCRIEMCLTIVNEILHK